MMSVSTVEQSIQDLTRILQLATGSSVDVSEKLMRANVELQAGEEISEDEYSTSDAQLDVIA